jgi:putative aldouronate transport system permease protein
MNNGIVNDIIVLFGGEKINFLNDPKYFRLLYVGSGIWQNFGFNSIIYIAAINSIDPTLLEVSKIDGITKFRQVYYITIPMIIPTIIILFILQLGKIMNVGFEKIFLMYSPVTYETADVISTYVYRKGIEGSGYSFATAVGFFNSVINFIFVYISNRISRSVTQTSLW